MKNSNSSSKNNHLKVGQKIAKRLFYSVIGLYLIIWLASPIIARYFLADYLKMEFSLSLSEDSSVRYNPFTSHLTVNDLSISKDGVSTFKLKKLDFEFRLHRLLIGQFYISALDLNGVEVLLQSTGGKLQIAGVKIDPESQDSDNGDKTNTGDSSEQKESRFELLAPKIDLQSILITLNSDQQNHQLNILSIELVNLFLSENKQVLSYKMLAELDRAEIDVALDLSVVEQVGKISTKFKLLDYDLGNIRNRLAKGFNDFGGSVSFDFNQTFEFDPQKANLTIPVTNLAVKNVKIDNGEITFKQLEQLLSLSSLNVKARFNADAGLSIDNLSIAKISLLGKQAMAQLEDGSNITNSGQNLIANGLLIDFNQGEARSSVELIDFNLLSTKLSSTSLQLSSEGLSVIADEMTLVKDKLSLASVKIKDLNAIMRLLSVKEGEKIENESIVVDSGHTARDKETATALLEEKSKKGFGFSVREFAFLDNKTLSFVDDSISPGYQRDLFLSEVSVKNIDSDIPQQESQFVIKGISDQYSKIDISGFIKPFTNKVNLSIAGSLSEISLPPASSYVQQTLGFEFESGALDTNLNIQIVDSKIKGNTKISIRGLALASAENYDQSAIQEQTAMPLNVALGMLKDDNDNVELDIPMLGDIDSPTFGMGSFFALITKKAIQSAAKSYLIKTFIPYAEIVSLTISAGDFILKTRFEDLLYEPAQIEFSDSQMTYMNQFVALMKDKENTQVKVCAIASINDLQEKQIDANEQDKTSLLKSLAKARMDYFKEWAVEQTIDSSRLLLCAPKIDLNKDSQPKVVISV